MMQWDESYETKIEKVDEQHKQLVRLINELNTEVISQLGNDNYDKIIQVLTELKQYTVDHFKHEEELMKNHLEKLEGEELAAFWDYFKNHRMEHGAFINKVNKIFEKDIDEQQAEITVGLIEFLVKWLKSHILQIDKQLPDFLNQ